MAGLIAGERLRVLLVSVQRSMQEEVERILSDRAGDHHLYWISQPDLAPSRAEDVVPHVILVDDELGGANPTQLVRGLNACVPGAAVVMVLTAEAVTLAQEVVLAGARGFVIKPLQPNQLISTLRQVVAWRTGSESIRSSSEAIGNIVVFCAPRGGTGRTTLAVNTAVSLHSEAKRPAVLVDADYAAPALDVALSLDNQSSVADLLPGLARLDQELISSVLAHHASGIDLLLAPPPASLDDPISLPQVQQILVQLKRMYPWVIVDLGLSLDETAFAFLDGADRIVMSVLPEMVGLRNTRIMLNQLHERGYPDERVWLVLNRANMKGGISRADIENRLRVPVAYRVPDDQALVTYSINRGVPVVLSHKRSALARAYRGFATRLWDEMPAGISFKPETASSKSGLAGRFFGRSQPAQIG